MRVGYFQFDPVFGEVARNLDLVTARLEQVEADLYRLAGAVRQWLSVCLPG